MIAMALINQPEILIADEPTTALDVTVQAQILELIRRRQKELGTAVIFVTHDLGVVASFCRRVNVMYAGRIVELGSARDVLLHPRHPYTVGMLASTVHGGRPREAEIEAIPGSPPDLRWLPPGCSFAPRCRHAEADCTLSVPRPADIAPGHTVCCVKASRLTRTKVPNIIA